MSFSLTAISSDTVYFPSAKEMIMYDPKGFAPAKGSMFELYREEIARKMARAPVMTNRESLLKILRVEIGKMEFLPDSENSVIVDFFELLANEVLKNPERFRDKRRMPSEAMINARAVKSFKKGNLTQTQVDIIKRTAHLISYTCVTSDNSTINEVLNKEISAKGKSEFLAVQNFYNSLAKECSK